MRGVGFEPTNPCGMRCPSQTSRIVLLLKQHLSIVMTGSYIRPLHLTPLTRLGNPRNNLLLYLTTYNAFYETQSEQHHFFIFSE
jgi:hypothetical protein